MRRRPVAFLAALASFASCASVLGALGVARAAGEDEWQLSARLGGANATGYPFSSWGLAGGLDLERGVSDAWSARLSVGTVAHPVSPVEDVSPAGTRRATAVMLGATYAVDVLRLVPYFIGGLGLLRWTGPAESGRLTLAADLGVGADYLLSPRWACGASAVYIFAPADLLNNAQQFGESPLAFSLTARISRIF